MVKLQPAECMLVAELAAQRPGVSRHRISRAIWRLGRRVHDQQPELLDDELAQMDQEALQARSGRTGNEERGAAGTTSEDGGGRDA